MQNSFSSDIQKHLSPSNLHNALKEQLSKPSPFNGSTHFSVKHISPNTIRFGNRLHDALTTLIPGLPVISESFKAKTGEDREEFLSNILITENDFVILQVHGSENEERLLEPMISRGVNNKLIIVIHRPEELFLRIAKEEGVSLPEAKDITGELLKVAKAVVLLGECCIPEYQEILPNTVVVAIPIGFVPSNLSIDLSTRTSKEAITVIGSNTTWGEMRHIEDLFELLKNIKQLVHTVKVIGFAMGKFDSRSDLKQYIGNKNCWFLGNKEVLNAHNMNSFSNEKQYRKWLFNQANGRVIIRAKILENEVIPESLSKSHGDLYV